MIDEIAKSKSIIVNLLVKELMAFLIKKLPFISFGPLSFIVSKVLSFYFEKLFVATITEIKVKLAESERKEQVENLNRLLKEYEAESNEQKKEAIEQSIINNAKSLIKLRP